MSSGFPLKRYVRSVRYEYTRLVIRVFGTLWEEGKATAPSMKRPTHLADFDDGQGHGVINHVHLVCDELGRYEGRGLLLRVIRLGRPNPPGSEEAVFALLSVDVHQQVSALDNDSVKGHRPCTKGCHVAFSRTPLCARHRRKLHRTPHTTNAITGSHGTAAARKTISEATDVMSVWPMPSAARLIGEKS